MPRRTLDLRVIGTMTLVLALACAPPPAERPFPGPFRVIDLDTLRADHLAARGNDRRELFRFRQDPLEQAELSASHPDVADDLYALLERWQDVVDRRGTPSADMPDLDADTVEKLKALGYLD